MNDQLKAAIDDFITEARGIDLQTVFSIVGGSLRDMRLRSGEHVGPCPVCGGKDRFNLNLGKGAWHCRQCDGGKGGDGFALVAQKHGYDLRQRAGLLGVCELILGRAAPDGSEVESDEARAAREEKIARRRQKSDADRRKSQETAERKRQFAISQGCGYWNNAGPALGSPVEDYLFRRTAAAHIPDAVFHNLRHQPKFSYFDGKDERGYDREIHCGHAMIAPLVNPLAGALTGSHQTWIDLGNPPKFRPTLIGIDKQGEQAQLVTKKMRGHHAGSILPISGDMDAGRWLCGEGIETTIAIADKDSWRDDTFYFAGGSIGNIAGPAEPKSRFRHPTLTYVDAKGVTKPVMVAGPVPKAGSEDDCFQLPAHVGELVLLADGDSEYWWTVACMARAEARLARECLVIAVWWPPDRTDFAALAAAAAEMEQQRRNAA